MEQKEAVQVSFRLPAGALEGFSRLVEQLRLLAAEVSGGATASPTASVPLERTENGNFDLEHFQTLSRELAPPESAGAELSPVADAAAVQAGTFGPEEAGSVRAGVQYDLAPPESAVRSVEDVPESVREEERDAAREEDIPSEAAAEALEIPEAEAIQAEQDSGLADAPAVRMEPESQIPEAEAVWMDIQKQNLNAVSAQAAAFSRPEEAQSALFDSATVLEEPRSRWGSVSEELAAAGPAPLTAEAVSLAFRRDGRRYDNGFPLY